MGGEKLDLEYRDDNGRIMTPKEAFRYLCWIFHGKKPGKNKVFFNYFGLNVYID